VLDKFPILIVAVDLPILLEHLFRNQLRIHFAVDQAAFL